jgi:hypothetical protein
MNTDIGLKLGFAKKFFWEELGLIIGLRLIEIY